jgi:hypothetical protein
MSATIHRLPPPADIAWCPIGEALRANIMRRTGSAEITDAVDARCRDVFERCFPNSKLISAGATQEEMSNVVHAIIGHFLSEVGELALELELLKSGGA